MRNFLFAVFLSALGGVSAAAQTTLTPDEMRSAALTALAKGQSELALGLADALLVRDPQDQTALLVRSRATRALGDYDDALSSAKDAWAAAETDGEKYRAALLRAQALSSAGSKTRAQLWLRRAVQLAPDERARKAALRDFRYVRDRNPLSVKLKFEIAPTNNANGGTTRTEELISFPKINGGLPANISGDARALPGTLFAVGADLSYRLRQTDRQRDQLLFSAFHRTYDLNSEANKIAPDARGSDFSFTSLSFGWRRDTALAPGKGLYGIGAKLGANWYGGEELSRFLELSADRTFRVGKRNTAKILVEGKFTDRRRGKKDEVYSVTAGGVLTHRLESVGYLKLSALGSIYESDSSSLDYENASFITEWGLGKPVMGTEFTLSAAYTLTEFGKNDFTFGNRTDQTAYVALNAVFPKIQRYGFAPSLTIEHRQRFSNVDFFDSETTGIKLGIESVF